MLLTEAGELLLVDQKSADLVWLDSSLKEKTRLKGAPRTGGEDSAGLSRSSSTVTGSSKGTFVWMCGDNSIGLVNPKSGKCLLIPNFFGEKSEGPLPVCAVADSPGARVAGVYCNRAGSWACFLADGAVSRQSFAGLYRSLGRGGAQFTPNCLEQSRDETSLLVAGTKTDEAGAAVCCLVPLWFERRLGAAEPLDLTIPSYAGRWAVAALRRLESDDAVVVGCFQALFIVGWKGRTLSVLGRIDHLHSGRRASPDMISGIDVVGRTVFTVCSKDQLISKTEFAQAKPEPAQKTGKRPSLL